MKSTIQLGSMRSVYRHRQMPLYAAYLLISTLVALGLYVSWWCSQAKDLGVSFSSKGELLSVQPGTLAARSGARPGDLITVSELRRLYQFSREARVGGVLDVTLAPRNSSNDRYAIQLEALPNDPWQQFDLSQEALTGIGFALLGIAPLVARRRTFSVWLFFFATECVAILLIADVPRRLHQAWAEPIAYATMPLFPAILFHFHTLFPQTRFGRWRAVSVAAVYLLAAVLVPLSLISVWDYSFYASVPWQVTYSVYVMGVLLVCVLMLVRAFVTTRSRQVRSQLKTILAFSGMGMFVTALLPFLAGALVANGIFGPLGLAIADNAQRIVLASALLTPIGYAQAILHDNLLIGDKLWRRWLVRIAYTSCSILLIVGGLMLVVGYIGVNWWEALGGAAPILLVGLVAASLVVSIGLERIGAWLDDKMAGDRSLARLLEECTEELQRFRELEEYVRFFTVTLPSRINSLGALVFLVEGERDSRALVLRGDSPSLPLSDCRREVPSITSDSELWAVCIDAYRPIPLSTLLLPESPLSDLDTKLLAIMKDARVELLLPLSGGQHAQQQLLGLVAMGEKETDEPYSAQEISALTALTLAASTSAENVLMFEALQRRLVELDQEREFSAALARDVSAAQDKERTRISSEIHDTVLQELVVVLRLLTRLRDQLQQTLGELEDSVIVFERLNDLAHTGGSTYIASARQDILEMLDKCQLAIATLLGEGDVEVRESALRAGIVQGTQGVEADLACLSDPSDSVGGKHLVEDIISLVRSTNERLREICTDLHPAYLDAPLVRTLSRSIERFRQLNPGVPIAFEVNNTEPPGLTDNVKAVCKKVMEQAVHNALNHAKSSGIVVDLSFANPSMSSRGGTYDALSEAAVMLSVVDDGVGFEPRTPSYWRSVHHHGLANMYGSAALIGGTLHIDSGPGMGTRVNLYIPLGMVGSVDLADTQRIQSPVKYTTGAIIASTPPPIP